MGYQHVMALNLAALALYFPANLYPFISMQYLGNYQDTTVYQGVLALMADGSWFTAGLVFLASMVIPPLKIMTLFVVALLSSRQQFSGLVKYLSVSVDVIGRWAMLDIFLMAIMVALFKFGSFATVKPGLGCILFGLMVILSIQASVTMRKIANSNAKSC